MSNISRDLSGRTFHRWTVIEPAAVRNGYRYWRCACECGTERDVLGTTLRNGTSKSCGCLATDVRLSQTHGQSYTSEYPSWQHMLNRCHNPDSTYYRDYGGRGITVCERWRNSPENFIADMGPRPTPDHTLERIDNDGPYSPENCRWATRREQARDRRSNRRLTHNGETLCLAEWAERLGITTNTLYMRLRAGWSVEKALTYESPTNR